ncbi:MAG: aldehyde dehydrogenase [Labilithrix sp.]|nr:aldehyde dehydrogenase [Labilithrix sp.]
MTFAAPPGPMPPTSLADVDAAIDALHEKRRAWRSVSLEERAALLDRCVAATAAVAEKWADVGARIKGIEPTDVLAGEEWLAGVMPTVRNARLLAQALRSQGRPRPAATRTGPGGRTIARVFPSTLMERLMFAGIHADVWIEKGKPASQGAIYRDRAGSGPPEPRVCLVLGGGNVSSIPAMDAFYKLFVEDELVLLKMNPVNEAIGPVLAAALAPLVDAGWLAIVYGGAEVGAHAAAHPKIGSLHVTGSDRTYDAIVWGGASPDERAARKARRERANDKPFSAELGCVTPVLVVPGPWSHADLRFQARHVASMVTQNASFNCNAGKVVVVAKQWLQKDAFLAALREELARTPPRKAYYPGARERYAAFLERYPRAEVVGRTSDAADDVVPWTVIPDVSADDYALRNEAFCGIVAVHELGAADAAGASPARFLEEAVKLANESCWGTLSCCLLVHPATEEAHERELAEAIDALRYGAIGVNVWPGVIYGLVSPTWGAYPGHTPEDIQSGTGVVHNTWLFDHPEKSVVSAPFRIRPTPAWFGDHENLLELGRRLVDFEAAPSWGRFAKVALAALKG